LLDERDLAGAWTCDCNGERKTTAVCDGHDLGPLAFAGGTICVRPPSSGRRAWVPSMSASDRQRRAT
jgi:hypothetical protein